MKKSSVLEKIFVNYTSLFSCNTPRKSEPILIYNILCAQADENEDGRLCVSVRIIMDDFAAGTIIPDFDKIISIILLREIFVSLILQSMTHFKSMYTLAAASAIINNCDHLLYLGT